MPSLIEVKKAVKNHGVKGFRKLKLKRELYVIGKQCSWLSPFIADRLIRRIEELGFEVSDRKTSLELAEKGFLDCITISPITA